MSHKANKRLSPLSIALGTAALTLAASSSATAASNPFQLNELPSGYMQLAEGKCGSNKGKSGNCGGYLKRYDANEDGKITKEEFIKGHELKFDRMDKNSDGVISGDEMKKGKEGKCGGDKKRMREGKCGEAKCGSNKG